MWIRRSLAGRRIILATIGALLLTQAPLSAIPAAQASEGLSALPARGDVTDFSARRRQYYRHRGNAAGLAFMGFAIGTIAGAIAAEQRRDYYESYGCCYGPGYYYGGPYYYGYYGPRYYYSPY
jgi:hypothetical protein